MAVTTKTQTTSRFIEPGLYIALFAILLVIFAGIASWFFGRTLLSQRLQVRQGNPVQLQSVQLNRGTIGALRINAKAIVPTNRWITYEIRVLDEQGNILGTAVKQAWKESGTWYEEGESGTWEEQDLRGGLDVRLGENEQDVVNLAVAVLEYTDTSGNAINQPVSFQVTVKKGVVDSRYLWAGLLGTISLGILSLVAKINSGKKVINQSVNNSDVGARRILGGSNSLVKVVVRVTSDEMSPPQLEARFWLKDGYGEQIYAQSLPMKLNKRTEDVSIGKVEAYFWLEKRGSYGFYVEVMPDQSVDLTRLTVYEKVRTVGRVEAVRIATS